MQILLTGATGYLGSRIADSLTGHQIIKFDSKSNLSDIKNPDIVVHCATCYGKNKEEDSYINYVNYEYAKHVLSRCEKSKFINIGTSLPSINQYSISKNKFSEYGKKNHKNFLDIKLEHFYGPNNSKNNFITFVSDSCKKNISELKLSTGKQKRDFIYIEDVVEAINLLIETKTKPGTVHLGSGKLISIKEVVEKIHRLHNSSTKLLFGAVPDRDDKMIAADITEIVLKGWKPRHNIDEGLYKTCV